MRPRNTASEGVNAEIFSVSDLNRAAKRLLEGEFPLVFVEGEISNFSVPASGHWYLTLKDAGGQLRTAMFRNRNQRVRFQPKNGMKVLIRGKISLYEARGEYQFIAEQMEEAGVGELRRAFEQLRGRLQEAGLFDQDRKRAIPELPQHLAIITSPTGAAVRDVLSVIHRRFPALRCTIIPSQVQGAQAADQVVAAIAMANDYLAAPFDAILLTRGGGSLEDLWTFNTEPVALAIADSRLPVVSAIGHESDVTIADFVADVRAATPSAAAEMLAPDQTEWMQTLDQLGQRITRRQRQRLAMDRAAVESLTRRLRDPSKTLSELRSRLVGLQRQLSLSVTRVISAPDLSQTKNRLKLALGHQLATQSQALAQIHTRLPAAFKLKINQHQNQLALLAGKLDALSPLAVLERGYTLVRDPSGKIVRSVTGTTTGDLVRIEFADGAAEAQIQNLKSTTLEAPKR